MLIRSQSKKTLYNLNRVKTLTVNNKCVFADSNLIGEYSTEEKALKVLDRIDDLYNNLKYIESYQLDFISHTFQMPKDEEVI